MDSVHTAKARRPRLRFDHSARYLRSHGLQLARVTRTELAARYAGSFLGLGWVVLAPLSIIGIYALVYLYIFRAATEATGLETFQYLLYIIAGFVPYLVTADAMANGVGSVVDNKAVLSNVVFPIDLVPAKAVLASQATMLSGAGFLTICLALTDRLHWTIVLFPLVWFMQVLALLGVVWVLSLLNVIFRDLSNLVTILLMMLLIASPIVYTTAMVPDNMKLILALNPLAYFIVVYQEIFVLGQLPTLLQAILLVSFSLVSFILGGWFFARAKAVLIDYV